MLTRRREARLREARRVARQQRLELLEEVRAAAAHAELLDVNSSCASTGTARTTIEPRSHRPNAVIQAGELFWHPILKVRVVGVNSWNGRDAEPIVQIARACASCGLPTGSFVASHCAKHA